MYMMHSSDADQLLPEQAWNGFPCHCLTVYESPFFGDSFHLSIESRYVQGETDWQDNALQLQGEELASREVVVLNIASEKHLRMTPDTDVRVFKSKESDRPVLDENGIWMRRGSPMIHCYKVCRLGLSAKGLPGSRIESWGHKHGLQAAFIRYNRQVFCWMDSWLGLKISDVDGFGDGILEAGREQQRLGKPMKEAVTAMATEIAAESSAGLAFAFSDETNPFFA